MSILQIRGFTLIEMLVALVISSLLAVVLFSGLNIAVRSSESINRLQQESGRAFTIQHSLRRIISAAQDQRIRDVNGVLQSAFRGSEREMIFVAPLRQLSDANRIFWLKLNIETDEFGNNQLVLKRRVFNPTDSDELPEALHSNQLDWEELNMELDLNGSTEMLYDSPGPEFSFEYQAVDNAKNVEWVNEWFEERELPVMIRINFDADNKRDWPELIVAPKDNAYAIKAIF